jgi:hypothetical protein
VSRVRDGAGVKLSEDFVAIPRNQVVDRVAERVRKEFAELGNPRPTPAQVREDKPGGIRACEQVLARLFRIRHYIESVQICRRRPVAAEEACGKCALQRGEAEDVVAIVPERELDQTVAQSADTVVEQDRVGGCGHRRVGPESPC